MVHSSSQSAARRNAVAVAATPSDRVLNMSRSTYLLIALAVALISGPSLALEPAKDAENAAFKEAEITVKPKEEVEVKATIEAPGGGGGGDLIKEAVNGSGVDRATDSNPGCNLLTC